MTDFSRMRQRVRIERRDRSGDGAGGATVAWILRAVVWAQVEPTSGQEQTQAAQQTAALTTRVTIRWRSDIAVTDRVVWGSRTLQIASVQDITGMKDELRMLCSEVQGQPAATGHRASQVWVESSLMDSQLA